MRRCPQTGSVCIKPLCNMEVGDCVLRQGFTYRKRGGAKKSVAQGKRDAAKRRNQLRAKGKR